MWKHIFILGFILTVIGGYVFWVNRPEQSTPQGALSSSVVHQIPRSERGVVSTERDAAPAESVIVSSDKEKTASDTIELPNEAQSNRDILRKMYGGDEESLTPGVQKMFALFDTPEYVSFLETQPTSFAAFWDFFASQGVPLDRNDLLDKFQSRFQMYFPGETPVTLEPQMREKLHNLVAESDGDILQVLTDFVSDEQNNTWGMLHFETDVGAFANWTVENFLSLSSMSTDAGVVEAEHPVVPTQDRPSGDLPAEVSETPSLPNKDGVVPKNHITAKTESEIRALLASPQADVPKLPTEISFVKILRGAFPPQRVNAAMQTLNRYKSQDALRRLRKSDPEIATYIERFVQKSKEEEK